MKYLLPCTCGQAIVVDVSQAGQMVACVCGRMQEAPSMRGIRALEPAAAANAEEASVRRAPAAWSPLQGGLFAVGILLVLAGLASAGWYGSEIRRINIPAPTEQDFIRDAGQIDNMPVDEVYEGYLKVRELGLGTPQLPLYAIAQKVEATYLRYVIAGAVAAGVGLVMVVSAFVIRPKA